MPFLTLNGTTVRVRSNAAPEKYNEHGLDRERMFDGAMRQTIRGRYRQWDLTSQCTISDSRTLIALLTSTSLPLLAAGDLIDSGITEECSVIPILVSNDPIQTANGFRRVVTFTLHETPAPLPADTTAAPWLFWRRGVARFTDDAGTVPTTVDGDRVAVWKDQSGNNRHGTQDGGIFMNVAARPETLGTAIHFGIIDAMQATWLDGPSLLGLTAAEYMVTLRATATPGGGGSGSGLISANQATLYTDTDGKIKGGFGLNGSTDLGTPADDVTEFCVFNESSSATGPYIARLNGTELLTVAHADYTFGFSGAFSLGAISGYGFWDGYVRDFVIFDAILTTSQRRSWYDYLSGAVDDPPLADL